MLYELDRNDFGKVSSLMHIVNHNATVIESVLQGNNAGRVFVNHLSRPTAALIYPQEMFFYIVLTRDDENFLREVHKLLFVDWKVQGVELFMYPEAKPEQINIILGDRPHVKLVRMDYIFNPASMVSFLPPTEYTMRHMDSSFFEDYPIEIAPGWKYADFHKHGFGYGLFKGDELVSHCAVVFRSDGAVELSVETNENYRRRGLALPVCSAAIQQAIGLGLTPTWSCWEFNEASWRLAEKLGLELKNKKQVYLWDTWVQREHDNKTMEV